jgi:repressor LexA
LRPFTAFRDPSRARLRSIGAMDRHRPGTRVSLLRTDSFFERPIAEHVRAGHPAMAFDSGHEALSIDEYLVSNPARTVLVRVKGDSMIDAGIHSGDTVVVEKRSSANVGDIVVAIIDNEFTLKWLGRERGQIVLRPEN